MTTSAALECAGQRGMLSPLRNVDSHPPFSASLLPLPPHRPVPGFAASSPVVTAGGVQLLHACRRAFVFVPVPKLVLPDKPRPWASEAVASARADPARIAHRGALSERKHQLRVDEELWRVRRRLLGAERLGLPRLTLQSQLCLVITFNAKSDCVSLTAIDEANRQADVRSYPILSDLIRSYPILSDPILPDLIRSDLIRSDPSCRPHGVPVACSPRQWVARHGSALSAGGAACRPRRHGAAGAAVVCALLHPHIRTRCGQWVGRDLKPCRAPPEPLCHPSCPRSAGEP